MEKIIEALRVMDRDTAHKLIDSVYDLYELADKFGLLTPDAK